jgi:hypothetical protein
MQSWLRFSGLDDFRRRMIALLLLKDSEFNRVILSSGLKGEDVMWLTAHERPCTQATACD